MKHAYQEDDIHPDRAPEVKPGDPTTFIARERQIAAHPRRSTVLLVEDEPMLAEVFRRLLVSGGFEVRACRTGMEALQLVRTDPSSVDVVLSDVRLPMMSGDRLAQEIRRLRADLPILLMTGFSATITQENAPALGVAAVLQKPLPARVLVTAIRDALLGATRAREASESVSVARQLEVVN